MRWVEVRAGVGGKWTRGETTLEQAAKGKGLGLFAAADGWSILRQGRRGGGGMAGGWLSRTQGQRGVCGCGVDVCGGGVLMNRAGELVRASEMDKRRIHKGGEDRWIGVGRNTRNRCQSSLMRSPHRIPGPSGRTIERGSTVLGSGPVPPITDTKQPTTPWLRLNPHDRPFFL